MLQIILEVGILAGILLNIGLTWKKKEMRVDQETQEQLADRIRLELQEQMAVLERNMREEMGRNRLEIGQSTQQSMERFSRFSSDLYNQTAERQDVRLKELREMLEKSQQRLEMTVSARLESLQQDNHAQLDRMRETVDEKLQKTLEDRITQSFQLVNDRLQEVYTGLGEMKNLASGVGDLKKVLTNVKTRGILGEYQLGAIIEEILTPEQYGVNVATKPGSANRVEYAIRLPGEDQGQVYLPVDAKFPGETYAQLLDAYDTGDGQKVEAARNVLIARIKGCAKDIHDKYIDPPNTTDFAIMFLPFEGLYAEVVRMGMVETLQKSYHVNIAGPTTFSALLNSLQMGFRTLAIQKRSGEVWRVLGAVKTEFSTFQTVLEKAKGNIDKTSEELDKLIGTRTRQINRKLKEVETLTPADASKLLEEVEN